MDIFTDWGSKIADLDIYKRSMAAGLVPTSGQATFGSGAGGAQSMGDSFASTDYQKIGMWIAAAGLIIAVIALMKGR
ncbi:hypothetical protein BEN30_00750 [Magnetovibrio blakemorei]|uniref:Uncharacterized protein n=1 Tax=Magnetovibrio blakemorei TaxID=28181 RepID=A0A1E5Q505_9PROT|nr:hypothetical protein BEN30_00750 [Magnetovibrio blakemorei]